MMNKNEVKIGDKIWFQESWTEKIIYGLVTKILDEGVYIDGVSHDDKSFIGSSGATWKNMYKTEDEAIFFKDSYTNQIISEKVVEADVNENKTSHARFRLSYSRYSRLKTK